MKSLTNAQIIESVGRVATVLAWELKEVWVSDGMKCVYEVIENGKAVSRFFLFNRALTQSHFEAALLDEMFEHSDTGAVEKDGLEGLAFQLMTRPNR